MTSPRWDDDERFLTDLGEALRGLPPAPADFVAAARAAWTWRTVDDELVLATLVFDSATDAGQLARTRSGRSARTLAFQGDGVTVEIELTETGIVGQLSPASGGQVTGEHPGGVFDRAEVDGIGCFLLRSPPPGPVRVRVRTGAYGVVTGWVCAD
ncbi:hypothetical protein ACNTMW_02735 [Planosporangium sp. 12N6]|uniref:hypothetical protein n=1 Tax=Planosporangium spinosum TaxID=3402278 RepID=UPI003CEA5A93